MIQKYTNRFMMDTEYQELLDENSVDEGCLVYLHNPQDTR